MWDVLKGVEGIDEVKSPVKEVERSGVHPHQLGRDRARLIKGELLTEVDTDGIGAKLAGKDSGLAA
jgi:hypothetical protein